MATIAREASPVGAAKRSYDAIHLAILDATIAVLEESGDINLRVSEVARRAHTTTGALYSHFRDREGLLTAAHLERLRRLRSDEGTILRLGAAVFSTDADRAEQTLRLESLLLTGAATAARVSMIDALVAGRYNTELRRTVCGRVSTVTETLTTWVSESQAAGITRNDLDPQAIAVTWIASVLGHTLLLSSCPDFAHYDDAPKLVASWDAMVHQFDTHYVQDPSAIAWLQGKVEEQLNDAWKARHLTLRRSPIS
jgi:AcrR family transcriptional regulator